MHLDLNLSGFNSSKLRTFAFYDQEFKNQLIFGSTAVPEWHFDFNSWRIPGKSNSLLNFMTKISYRILIRFRSEFSVKKAAYFTLWTILQFITWTVGNFQMVVETHGSSGPMINNFFNQWAYWKVYIL